MDISLDPRHFLRVETSVVAQVSADLMENLDEASGMFFFFFDFFSLVRSLLLAFFLFFFFDFPLSTVVAHYEEMRS